MSEITKESRADRAIACHNKGYNCAQSVAFAFLDKVDIDPETLFKVTEGLGLGMGGMEGTCGAISAAAVLAGLKISTADLEKPNSKGTSYKASKAWLHHKGRNKHHFEYWIDVSLNKEEGLVGNKMPVNYVAEMLCDRIAACEVYRGKNYTSAAPMEYYEFTKKYITIHPETRALLEKLLTILKDEGEESAYAYIRKLLKKGSY